MLLIRVVFDFNTYLIKTLQKVKIITNNQPSTTEHHGCPFRHYNQENLKTLLTKTLGASEIVPGSVTNSVNDILKIVGDGHYQIACTRMYEIVHQKGDKNTIDVIEHPNEWFELSSGIGKREMKVDEKAVDFKQEEEMVVDN